MKTIRTLALFLLFAILAAAPTHASASTSESSQLDPNSPQKIYVAVGVLDIDGIDSATQSFTVNLFVQFRWHDPQLAHDGDSDVRTQLIDIHAPRFLLLNRQKTWSSLLNVVDKTPSCGG